MAQVFLFGSLATADLVIDAVYEGGTKGNTADDPLGKLIPGAGNQGGLRQVGGWTSPKAVVLYSSADDPDWPDFIDIYAGASQGDVSESPPRVPPISMKTGFWRV